VTTPSGTTTTTFTYEGLQLFRVASATASQTTTLTYLYDELGRAAVAAGQVSGDPKVYFVRIVSTSRGDVTALTDCGGQGAGKTLAGWAYDVYGNATVTAPVAGSSLVPTSVASAIASAQPLRYAGYAYDSFSGLYYCSQRYYDPATCQFISADPVGADGEQSAYQYCGGDPVNHTDPSGLMMDFYDTGRASSTGAAHEAMVHAKDKARRAAYWAKMVAAAKREKAQKARETAARAAGEAGAGGGCEGGREKSEVHREPHRGISIVASGTGVRATSGRWQRRHQYECRHRHGGSRGGRFHRNRR